MSLPRHGERHTISGHRTAPCGVSVSVVKKVCYDTIQDKWDEVQLFVTVSSCHRRSLWHDRASWALPVISLVFVIANGEGGYHRWRRPCWLFVRCEGVHCLVCGAGVVNNKESSSVDVGVDGIFSALLFSCTLLSCWMILLLISFLRLLVSRNWSKELLRRTWYDANRPKL